MEKRGQAIFILRDGEIEDYLPKGHRQKDIEKLINLVAKENFWSELPANRKELEDICGDLLRMATQDA